MARKDGHGRTGTAAADRHRLLVDARRRHARAADAGRRDGRRASRHEGRRLGGGGQARRHGAGEGRDGRRWGGRRVVVFRLRERGTGRVSILGQVSGWYRGIEWTHRRQPPTTVMNRDDRIVCFIFGGVVGQRARSIVRENGMESMSGGGTSPGQASGDELLKGLGISQPATTARDRPSPHRSAAPGLAPLNAHRGAPSPWRRTPISIRGETLVGLSDLPQTSSSAGGWHGRYVMAATLLDPHLPICPVPNSSLARQCKRAGCGKLKPTLAPIIDLCQIRRPQHPTSAHIITSWRSGADTLGYPLRFARQISPSRRSLQVPTETCRRAQWAAADQQRTKVNGPASRTLLCYARP